ncbi:hypothetical protein U1Q18_049846, partial [Sarracenia purpurea var. burkii]
DLGTYSWFSRYIPGYSNDSIRPPKGKMRAQVRAAAIYVYPASKELRYYYEEEG